jgi:glyoxylate carboligase
MRADRELPAQHGLVRQDEPAVQRAACLSFTLINANGEKGFLVNHAIEQRESALLKAARASENYGCAETPRRLASTFLNPLVASVTLNRVVPVSYRQ